MFMNKMKIKFKTFFVRLMKVIFALGAIRGPHDSLRATEKYFFNVLASRLYFAIRN